MKSSLKSLSFPFRTLDSSLWGSPLGISLCVFCVCPLSHHGVSFVQNGDPSLWWLWGLKLWMFTRTSLSDVAMNGLWMLSKRFPGRAGKGVRDDISHNSEAETRVQSTREREGAVRWVLYLEDETDSCDQQQHKDKWVTAEQMANV